MPHSRDGFIGLARQADWGTPGTNFHFFASATETLGDGHQTSMIRDDFEFGARTPRQAWAGTESFSGGVSIASLRGNDLPEMLMAAMGGYTVTGPDVDGNYSHRFTPMSGRFSSNAALRPVTIAVSRGGIETVRYDDCQMSSLSISTDAEGHKTAAATEWMAKTKTNAWTPPTPTYTEAPFLLWRNARVTINGSWWNVLRSFEFSINNGLASDRTSNQSPFISHVDFDRPTEIKFSAEARFENRTLLEASQTKALQSIRVEWDLPDTSTFVLEIPKAQVISAGASVGGGDISQRVEFRASRDSVSGFAVAFTTKNKVVTYE